ncbi:Transmembrane 64 [Brachionus plicatilis]|uniref:Transmembrane 64 n=1 Tax=Brachionus plicatilis TaxID=10195 RepID=A0A3M7Q9E3_BRAPC|nr:Transmembrane 64 [Brachionus plicatilis]
MQELSSNNDLKSAKKKFTLKNFSFVGLFTCLITLVLAFLFKDNFLLVLSYLDKISTKNLYEFHLILIFLFICVSLPILWGHMVCILICSYVFSFFYGFILVSVYSTFGMVVAYFACRFAFYDCAHQRVKNIAYLQAINTLLESKERGFQIILLCRLMPLPFGLANTLFSVTDVDFKKYMTASIIGLMPSELILCYMGSTLKSMSDVLVNEKTAKTAYLVFVAQLFIAVGVLYYILRAAKKEINKHLENNKFDSPKDCQCSNNDCDKCHLISV